MDENFIESEFLYKTVNNWLKKKKLKVSYKLVGKVNHKFSHFQLKVLVVKLDLSRKLLLENFFLVNDKRFK